MTPVAVAEQEREADPGFVAGMIDHDARMAIRDLIRVHGFEEARDLVAHFLNDEADRRPRS